MHDADATVVSVLGSEPARSALLLDYDGSLAPIVDRPEDAVPLPGAVALLGDLAGRLGRVAIVSGRPVAFLAERVPAPGVTLVGLYGIERVERGVRTVDPRVANFVGAVARAADEAEARLPGVIVERKEGVSVTLHWRTEPEREHDVRAVASELASRLGLDAPQRGRMSVELRPPIPVDKGTAVETLVEGFAAAAFAGDDAGDIPAFEALARAAAQGRIEQAVRIGVRSPEAPARLAEHVDVVVDGPEGLLILLGGLRSRLRD